MSIYPHDIKIGTRTLAERFLNIRSWVEHDSGGHFAAWEQPESYVQGIHNALDLVHGPHDPSRRAGGSTHRPSATASQ